MRNADDERKFRGECPYSLSERIPVGPILVQGSAENWKEPLFAEFVPDAAGVFTNLGKPPFLEVRDVCDGCTRAGLVECEEFVCEHVRGLFLCIHDGNPFSAAPCEGKEPFCGEMLQVTPGRLDIRPGRRTAQPLDLVCGCKEPFLAFKFIFAYPAFCCRRFEGGNHSIDILREPGMDLDRYRGSGDSRVPDG
jgi:hypothetical protein